MSRPFLLVLALAGFPAAALGQAPAAPQGAPEPPAAAPLPPASPQPAPVVQQAPGTSVAPPPRAQPLPVRTAPVDSVSEVDPIDIPPEHDPLAHAWDRPSDRGGLYLRLSTSIGVHSTRLGPAPWQSDNGRVAHGFGSGFGLDIGAFLAPWIALHLDATAGMLWNGNIHYEYDRADADNGRARIAAFGFAPAVTFFTPRSFYMKSAFGVGFANVKQPGKDNMTDPGFYMDLALGKDLYVDRNFAFGLQFQVVYMLLGDESRVDEARVHQYLFGFSGAFDSI